MYLINCAYEHYYSKCKQPQSSSLFFFKLETSLDGDNPEHIQWVFERAKERAVEYNITGVEYRLTQGEHVNKEGQNLFMERRSVVNNMRED